MCSPIRTSKHQPSPPWECPNLAFSVVQFQLLVIFWSLTFNVRCIIHTTVRKKEKRTGTHVIKRDFSKIFFYQVKSRCDESDNEKNKNCVSAQELFVHDSHNKWLALPSASHATHVMCIVDPFWQLSRWTCNCYFISKKKKEAKEF
jgi:hypothetical protein